MKHDFTFSGSGIPGKWISSEEVESGTMRELKKREYNKKHYAQINFKFRKGSDSLIQLDYIRGDVTRHAYVKQIVEDHLTKITNLLEK